MQTGTLHTTISAVMVSRDVFLCFKLFIALCWRFSVLADVDGWIVDMESQRLRRNRLSNCGHQWDMDAGSSCMEFCVRCQSLRKFFHGRQSTHGHTLQVFQLIWSVLINNLIKLLIINQWLLNYQPTIHPPTPPKAMEVSTWTLNSTTQLDAR